MKRTLLNSLSLSLLLLAGAIQGDRVVGQEPPVVEPSQEHKWLAQFVGDWTTDSKGTAGPGQPPMECAGKLSSKKLGEFWVLNEMKGDMVGTPMNGMQTIGYDETKKKFVGTWVDSMSPFMWRYEGTLDKSGKVLTLEADGPNFTEPGKLTKFQDIYEFKSKDEIAITSKMLGSDGKWITFMSGAGKRIK